MDAETIIGQARGGSAPSEWNVWPLRRNYLISAAIKWGALAVVGFALFIPTLLITFNDDVLKGNSIQQSVGVVLILLTGAIAFGSAWIVVEHTLRVRNAASYWLVITPELFVKAAPSRLYSIPLEAISDITLKGVATPDHTQLQEAQQLFSMGPLASATSRFNAFAASRRRSGESPSLAFRDSRDNRVIIVSTDESFDHLGALNEILVERVGKREMEILRAKRKK